jgi:hypothetical protein
MDQAEIEDQHGDEEANCIGHLTQNVKSEVHGAGPSE